MNIALTIVILIFIILPSYSQEENIDSTFYNAKKHFEKSKNEKNIDTIIKSTIQLANLLHSRSNYINEIEILLEGLNYLESKKYLITKADFLYKLGEVARAARKFDAGLEYLSEAEDICKEKKEDLKLAKIYNRKAAIFFEIENNKFPNTLFYLEKSTNKAKQYNDYALIARNLEIKGAVFSSIGKFENAIENYMFVIKIFEDNGEEAFPNVYINLCIVYYRLKNFKLSVEYGKKALNLEKKKCSMPQLETVNDMVSNAYVAMEDYKNAYEYIIKSYNYQALLFNENRDDKISELNKKYQTEKKEQEIEKQKKINELNKLQLKKRQNENLLLIIGIFLTVILLFVFYRQKKRTNKLNKQLGFKNNEIEEQSQKLGNQNKQLIKLDKFKNSMNSMLVHDLKNPLNIILGNIQKEKEDEKSLQIQDAASKMLIHISNLLDVNKYENSSMVLNLREFDMQSLIDIIYSQIKYSLEVKNIRFQTNIIENYVLNADKNIIERIFINLLTNAIKFTPQNGKISLSASPKNDTFISISIADSGTGIPENMHKFVFEKYGQINSDFKTKSTGLGLAFCKIAVETHGGKISIVKNKKNGAEFVFNLPYTSNKNTILFCKTKKILKLKKKTDSISLSTSEKNKIKPYIEELEELDVFCITDVKEVLVRIKGLNINCLNELADNINLALKTCNQNMYDAILKNTIEPFQ